jgi:dTDP-4-dehydrorhamnose 3,5-epimerase
MNFEIEDTAFPEIKIIHGKRFADERGYFSETYKIKDFQLLGLPEFVQDNMSKSSKGVIRGLHWQVQPYGQGKLVQCITGSIFDVVVDVRPESPTFKKYETFHLEDSTFRLLWVPEGFAHGFQATSENTIVSYKVTNYWNKESERAINPIDPDLKISWPIVNQIISEKDSKAENLNSL